MQLSAKIDRAFWSLLTLPLDIILLGCLPVLCRSLMHIWGIGLWLLLALIAEMTHQSGLMPLWLYQGFFYNNHTMHGLFFVIGVAGLYIGRASGAGGLFMAYIGAGLFLQPHPEWGIYYHGNNVFGMVIRIGIILACLAQYSLFSKCFLWGAQLSKPMFWHLSPLPDAPPAPAAIPKARRIPAKRGRTLTRARMQQCLDPHLQRLITPKS